MVIDIGSIGGKIDEFKKKIHQSHTSKINKRSCITVYIELLANVSAWSMYARKKVFAGFNIEDEMIS